MEKRNGSNEPRWLNDDQMAAWLELIGVLMWLPSALDAQLQSDAGISHFQYQVLAMLSTAPARTSHMHELAARTNSSASRLSHAVRRMEEQGWIERESDPANRRFIRATLTDAGWAKLVECAPGHVAAVQHYVFDQLTPAQTRQLHEIARSVRSAAEAVRPTPAVEE